MHLRQFQPIAADRRTDQTVEIQQQGIGGGIGTVPLRCQARARYATLASLNGGRTLKEAYRHRSEARQQC